MNSLWQNVIVVLVALGGGMGLSALIRVFTDRPKTRADAVKALSEAGTGMAEAASVTFVNIANRLERIETRSEAQGLQLDEQDHQIASLTAYVDNVSGWAVRHQPYDEAVRGVARDHGVTLPVLETFPEFHEWAPPRR